MHGSASIVIKRPVTEVWDFISDISRLDQWITGSIFTTPISSGPIQPGWQFESHYTFGKVTNLFLYEIMVYAPPSHFAFGAVKGKFPTIRKLELFPDGSWTRITNTLDAGSRGTGTRQAIIGIMNPLLRLLMRQQLKREIRVVKSKLESVLWNT